MTIDGIIGLSTFIINLFLINYLFANQKKQPRLFSIENMSFLIMLLILIASSFVKNIIGISIILCLIFTISAIFICAHKYRVAMGKAVFWLFTFFFVYFFSDAFTLTLLQGLIFPQGVPLLYSFIFPPILQVIMILLVKILFFNKQNPLQTLHLPLIFALGTVPMISVAVLFDLTINHFGAELFKVFMLLALFCINFATLYLYLVLSRYFENITRVSVQNYSLESELKFFHQVKKDQAKICSLRHDMKNQYLVVEGLLEAGSIAEAKSYLQKSTAKLDTEENFYTHNYVLNYLLNEKNAIARRSGISMNMNVFLPEKISIDNEVLAIVIGNLLDNALQAATRLTESQKREISVNIKQFGNRLKIDVSNLFNSTELKERKDRQIKGIGLKNIKKIIEENNGIYQQRVEKNRYFTNILLLNTYNV
ncbi:MAG: GHKL domain-containing protein [Streptococcaceae bacterium]|jgi:signal transduction histidine kinase|nr:GHKL domain-containing protein [Streptococcaceae bacterium]